MKVNTKISVFLSLAIPKMSDKNII